MRTMLTALTSNLIIASSPTMAAQEQDTLKTFVPMASYDADLVVNTTGGLKTGACYVGYATLGIEINPWKHGTFNFMIGSTQGGYPTEDYVGDLQWVNSNEGGNHIFAINAWYRHTIGPVAITAGLQDMNDIYTTTEVAGNMMNSAFTMSNSFSVNTGMPSSPVTGLGVNVGWQVNDSFLWNFAAFDGKVYDLDDGNRFNLKYSLSKREGFILASEAQITPSQQPLTLKVGTYYHTARENWGIYAMAEGECARWGERKLEAFGTFGYSPRKREHTVVSLTCGGKLTKVFSSKGNDALTLGLASAYLAGHPWESSLELNYRYDLWKYFFVAPDIQWVINPARVEGARNALVCSLRLGFEL